MFFLLGVSWSVARADGMQPETTVVVLYEEEGEASIQIKNTDNGPALLHSAIESIPEDLESLVVITPPVTRVDAGETQLVRLLSANSEPLKTQRLKRVTFEGIPQRKTRVGATVGISLRQNLPLILHPKGLARHPAPWKELTWHREKSRLVVRNDSPYVVRLSPELELNPHKVSVMLSRGYVLPGEALAIEMDATQPPATSVTLQPATVYGFAVARHEAPILAEAL
ncbi:fimbria/pilus chaperone family protein [Pseudomonas sp. MWU13-2105]|uniref:fimbria/pilus chaperone family protein n=1 Tax=Pseudomonas sp. MWU13-2105 TaxID=2935074 RepID=UPI0021F07A6B|nr:fimbria/pilus chaperone family protein [Pseudomonas sp. MWU13-2105]